VTTGAPEGADAPAAVARGLSAAVLQRGGSLSLKLTPESLGQVRIDMTMDKGSVAVRIEAGSVAAQDLLESSMAMLRSTLEGKGLSVDRISVHLAPGTAAAPAPSGAQNQHEAQQQQSGTSGNSNHQNAGEGASKGRDQRDPDQLWLFENQPDDAAEDRGTFRLKLSAVA
jgi:flagellar hook-length control protein FliK